MKRISPILGLIDHYRHTITIVLGILIVGFLDENSLMRCTQLGLRASDIRQEIEHYKDIHEANKKQLNELKHDPHAFTKIARERYFMKTDDEDIYVLSDDKRQNAATNETTK